MVGLAALNAAIPSGILPSAGVAYAHYLSFMVCFGALVLERRLIRPVRVPDQPGGCSCQRQASCIIWSSPRSACQPSSRAALAGSAQHSAMSPGRRGAMR